MKKYESYKDSGIEWIGEIPSHWDTLRLCYLGNFSSSGIDKKINPDEELVKIINFTDIYNNLNGVLDSSIDYMIVSTTPNKKTEHSVVKGDLIFLPSSETYEDLGKSAIVNEELENVSFSYHVIRLNFTSELAHGFKKYLTNNYQVLNQFSSNGQGTTRKIIGRNVFRNIKVVIPSIEEQTAIANYLDQKTAQIDELIAKKERLIQLLEEERTALINQAVTKGLDPTVPMKDSGIEWLGEIPAHWEVKKLKFMANLKSGENITSENIKEDGDYPVYGGNGVRGYYSDYTNDGEYILIGRQGALCGNIKYASNRFWASEHAIVCYLKPNVNWLWFGKLLESMNLNQYNQSAAQPGLAVGVIKNLSIPIPNIENQNEIVEFIIDFERRTDDIIQKTRKEIELLKEYKTALISEVVTGKVDVRDEKLS